LAAFCPYHNVSAQRYPPLLVSTNADDDLVPCWGPLKYAARLRQRASEALVKVWTDSHRGHVAQEGQHFATKATHYAFLMQIIGGARALMPKGAYV
ncbi:hypothetical protein H632_c1799p0, partial [Helicosporidium sp. ATCC 50920]